jgi:hypothetical protein
VETNNIATLDVAVAATNSILFQSVPMALQIRASLGEPADCPFFMLD